MPSCVCYHSLAAWVHGQKTESLLKWNEIWISLSEHWAYGPYLNMANTQAKFWSNKYLASWVIDTYSYKLAGYPSVNRVTMSKGLKKLSFNSNIVISIRLLFPLPPLPPCWTNNREASLSLNNFLGRIKTFSYCEIILFTKLDFILQMKCFLSDANRSGLVLYRTGKTTSSEWGNQSSLWIVQSTGKTSLIETINPICNLPFS